MPRMGLRTAKDTQAGNQGGRWLKRAEASIGNRRPPGLTGWGSFGALCPSGAAAASG